MRLSKSYDHQNSLKLEKETSFRNSVGTAFLATKCHQLNSGRQMAVPCAG